LGGLAFVIIREYILHFPTIAPHEPATRARQLMRDTGVRILPVVEDHRLRGIISRLGVLSITSTRSNLRAIDIASEPSLTISPEEELREALEKMLNVDEWYAPVVDIGNRYIGVFGLEKVIEKLLEEDHPSLGRKVEEVMSTNIETIEANDNVASLWRKMMKYNYAGFPVVDGKGKLIGVVTQYDLIRYGFTRIELRSESPPRTGPRIREIMSTPPITVKIGDELRKAAELMIKHDIGRVLVVNNKKELKGIIDREDIIRSYLKHSFKD